VHHGLEEDVDKALSLPQPQLGGELRLLKRQRQTAVRLLSSWCLAWGWRAEGMSPWGYARPARQHEQNTSSMLPNRTTSSDSCFPAQQRELLVVRGDCAK